MIVLCKVPTCDKISNSLGYCKMHYTRLKRYGILERSKWKEKCKIANCSQKHYGLGQIRKLRVLA